MYGRKIASRRVASMPVRSGVDHMNAKLRRSALVLRRSRVRRGLHALDAQDELAMASGRLVRHRLHGVDEEIQDGLLEEALVDLRDERRRRDLDPLHDALALRLRQEEVRELLDDLAHVVRLRVELQSPGEAEEVGEDVAQAIGLARERVHAPREPMLRVVGQLAVADLLADELRIQDDDGRERGS
jgi:hypothetical protein